MAQFPRPENAAVARATPDQRRQIIGRSTVVSPLSGSDEYVQKKFPTHPFRTYREIELTGLAQVTRTRVSRCAYSSLTLYLLIY